ncbi:MAG: shikimate dehydrogenase [Acidobacteria bacterium]|nr:shikimate dehydrogenase [Acidobacteriota bacterium]
MNNGKLCIPVCERTADKTIEQIKLAAKLADIIEIRFDCIRSEAGRNETLRAIDETAIATPLIATLRSVEEGGTALKQERVEFWKNALPKFAAIDLESDLVSETDTGHVRIGSLHDLQTIPSDLPARAKELACVADILKVAATARDAVDALPIWNLLEEYKAVIPIAMGEGGKWTRILGLPHGAYLTYAALEDGMGTADGQIAARDMLDVYRVKHLNKQTKVYGIVGDPVSSSMSPYFQNAAFRDAGLNAVFIPLLVKDLEAFIRRMVRRKTREVELNFGGFSVTMPHKVAIMELLDEIDPVAKAVGAVNTVVIVGDKLIGYNTDAYGFIEPLERKFGDLNGAKVSIAGAGGAARACVYAFSTKGVDVTIYARDHNKAKAIAGEFGAKAGAPDVPFEPGSVDILVNATPLGMKGSGSEGTIATADKLKGVSLVYDLVYNPAETRLMKEAKKAGVQTIAGAEMLIAQGERQFELWTGQRAPVEKMKASLDERLDEAK